LENNGDTMSQSRILINISKAFWNKIPDGIRYELLEMALDIPGLSARSIEGNPPPALMPMWH